MQAEILVKPAGETFSERHNGNVLSSVYVSLTEMSGNALLHVTNTCITVSQNVPCHSKLFEGILTAAS